MDIIQFVNELVNHIKSEGIFRLVLEKMEKDNISWDIAARVNIGKVVKNICPDWEINVEGEGIINQPYKLFGSIGQYPDIRILKPYRIAVELDHFGRKDGNPGSGFKMALAKAAFGYLSGDWDYCVVLFYNHTEKSLAPYLGQEKEQKILDFYRDNFRTQIFLFE